jgi:hypothetical protein
MPRRRSDGAGFDLRTSGNACVVVFRLVGSRIVHARPGDDPSADEAELR